MGFEDECFRETVDEMIDGALSSGVPQLAGITRERLEREPQVRLNLHGDGSDKPWLPFANGFPTPNGTGAALTMAHLIAHGMDPVAEFVAPEESRHTDNGQASIRWNCWRAKADNFLNSTFVNLPSLQKMERQHELEISRRDAESRGIQATATGSGCSTNGARSFCTARVDGTVSAGVVGAKLGWAKLSAGGVNINVLTSARLTDLGGGATFYSTLVEVERVPETSSVRKG